MSDRAPSFALPSDDGRTVSLADFAGQYLILYFYPKDDTPGCTREAQAFTAAKKELAKRDVAVVGVSRDSIARHEKFRAKYDLDLILLSDTDAAVHRAYGAYGEKKLYGKVSEGALRTTFLVDPNGRIVRRYANFKVDGHVDTVLRDLDAERAGETATPATATAATQAPVEKAAATKKKSTQTAPAASKPTPVKKR